MTSIPAGKCSVLIITIGIPGCGKSTWAANYKREHPYVYIISSDEVRKDLHGSDLFIPEKNEEVRDEVKRRVKKILDDPENYKGLGPTILVDSTNTDWRQWVEYKALMPTIIIAKVFDDITPEIAMERQKNRERVVPKNVLEAKWAMLEASKPYLSRIFNMLL